MIGTISIITVINNNNHLFIFILFKKVYLNSINNKVAIKIEIKYPITTDNIIKPPKKIITINIFSIIQINS